MKKMFCKPKIIHSLFYGLWIFSCRFRFFPCFSAFFTEYVVDKPVENVENRWYNLCTSCLVSMLCKEPETGKNAKKEPPRRVVPSLCS